MPQFLQFVSETPISIAQMPSNQISVMNQFYWQNPRPNFPTFSGANISTKKNMVDSQVLPSDGF
jgi:hypothetical protein